MSAVLISQNPIVYSTGKVILISFVIMHRMMNVKTRQTLISALKTTFSHVTPH